MGKFRNRNKPQDEQPINPAPEVPAETPVETATETVAETFEEVGNNFAEAAEKLEAQGIEPVAPVEVVTTNKRGVIPDAFGNNVKGERLCSVCGIKESETLAKNPRYSFCKGKCVNCYGKTERKTTKPSELTIPQLEEKVAYYTDLLQKKLAGAQGLPEGNAAESSTANTDAAAVDAHGANLDDLEIAEVSR